MVESFPAVPNATLCRELGISERTLARLARERDLHKDMEAIKSIRVKHLSDALRKSTKMMRRTRHPENGKKTRFKPGFKPIDLFGEEKFHDAHKKAAETRKKRFAEEKARVTFGLPQKTRMRVIRQPKQKILDRSYLKRRGYIIDDRENIAYWTDQTRRATRMEARPKRFYTFKKYEP